MSEAETSQADSMLTAWIEAQKALWESWGRMASAASEPPFSSGLVDQWQRLARLCLAAQSAKAAPAAQNVAEQFLAAQGIVLRFLEFSARAWEAAAPQLQAGADWQGAFRKAADQLRRQWLQFPFDAAGAQQDAQDLWQLYLEQWKGFGQPWEAVLRRLPEYWGQAAAGKSAAQLELSQLYREAYDQTFGRLAASPGLGLAREFNLKLRQGFDAWVAWRLANDEYQAVLAEMWDKVFEQFTRELEAMAGQDKKIDNVWDLISAWTRNAEQVFTEAFRSEKYVLAQSKLLNASLAYRVRERAIVQEFLELYDLPTRSELDEAHRRIYELRKQVKALTKSLAELREERK